MANNENDKDGTSAEAAAGAADMSQDARGTKVAVGQFAPSLETQENIAFVHDLVKAAAENGSKLIVLPEYSSACGGVLGPWVNEHAEELTGAFLTAMMSLCTEYDMAMVVGMLESNSSGKPFNSVVALDAHGIKGIYRKVHLYDAFGGSESEWVSPGNHLDDPIVVELAGMLVGLQTCYDIRFPEVSRRLVDAGAQVLAVPAQWVAGPKKAHHWVALTAARAIENMCFVAAADQTAPIAIGMSRIVSPWGETLMDTGAEPGLAIAPIEVVHVDMARQANPALAARKYNVAPITPD